MSENSKIEWTDATWQEKSAARKLGIDQREYVARLAIGEKWCTKCKCWHSRWIFPVDRSRGDGLASSCRGYKPKTQPLSDEEKRERANRSYRQYYASGGKAAINARKSARKRNCAPVTERHREFVFDLFDGACAYCQRPATTIDHLVPVSKGGHSGRGNIVPACVSCNSRKKCKDYMEFLATCGNPMYFEIWEEIHMEDVL